MKTSHDSSIYLASGDYLAVVRDFALGKGIPTSVLLDGAEVSLADLLNPPSLVPNLLFNRLGANLYYALDGDMNAAVEFGLKMTAATHGSLGVAVRCSQNLREAYSVLREYFNTRINFQDISYQKQGALIEVRLITKDQDIDHDQAVRRFYDLSTLVSIATNTYQAIETAHLEGKMRLIVDDIQPNLQNQPELSFLEWIFEGSELMLTIPASWMDRPLNIADAEMAKIALEKCADELEELSPKALVQKVSRIIDESEDIPLIDDMAARFYMSTATFKRKLKNNGATYQSLKDRARRSKAEQLILTGRYSLEDIAYKLGFNNASNFSKSFKNWTGQTPAMFKNSRAEEENQA